MKAWGLTISIPINGDCNKNCPYCISKMTGYITPKSKTSRKKYEI